MSYICHLTAARIEKKNRESLEEYKRMVEAKRRAKERLENPDPCRGFGHHVPIFTMENEENYKKAVERMKHMTEW